MKAIESYSYLCAPTTVCPICTQISRRLFSQYNHWIRVCGSCKHQFAELTCSPAHVNRVYSDRYFQGGDAGYPDYLAEASVLRSHGRRYGRLLARYAPPGKVLDVGAAAGFILQGLEDCGWQGRGIEPNPRMANYARTRLGLNVDSGTLEQLECGDRYDLVTMIQVIAHFYDLRQALASASIATKPGGYWLIETWNRDSLTARILGKHWHEYSPPSVLHWFSPSDLQQLAAQFGFREVARGRPTKWINAAHAKSLLRYKLKDFWWGRLPSKMLDLISDRLAIPYPAEDLFWALFQKL